MNIKTKRIFAAVVTAIIVVTMMVSVSASSLRVEHKGVSGANVPYATLSGNRLSIATGTQQVSSDSTVPILGFYDGDLTLALTDDFVLGDSSNDPEDDEIAIESNYHTLIITGVDGSSFTADAAINSLGSLVISTLPNQTVSVTLDGHPVDQGVWELWESSAFPDTNQKLIIKFSGPKSNNNNNNIDEEMIWYPSSSSSSSSGSSSESIVPQSSSASSSSSWSSSSNSSSGSSSSSSSSSPPNSSSQSEDSSSSSSSAESSSSSSARSGDPLDDLLDCFENYQESF